jgi:hypothetical protein
VCCEQEKDPDPRARGKCADDVITEGGVEMDSAGGGVGKRLRMEF